MEKKSKKLLIATGVLITALVAAMPLTSYAATSQKTGTISVKVAPTITMEITVAGDDPATEGKDMNIEVSPNMVGSGGFSARVSSNKIYTLSINARNGKTDMTLDSDPTGATVNKIPGTGNVVAGTTSWGVKLRSDSAYKAIPATPTVFYTSKQAVTDETTNFDVGISVGSSLLAGKYSGTLVVTAANP